MRTLSPAALVGGIFMSLATFLCADARDLAVADPALTPGAVRSLTIRQICRTKWGTDRRAVTAAMKRQVFASYGLSGNDDPACVPDKHGRRCEVDHLIPRSLGGKDAVENLWPQPFGTKPWSASRKDRLEAALSRDVCAGRISLERARALIRNDYRIEYRRRWGEPD
jgi:hypothetical protein